MLIPNYSQEEAPETLQLEALSDGLTWKYDHDCATWYMILKEHASQ